MTKVTTFIACVGLYLVTLIGGPPATEDSLLSHLDWLAGRWVMESEGQTIEESWSPATHDAMVGTLRWARTGKVWLYELMSIELEEDQLVLRIRHFGRELEPWESEADGPVRMTMQDFSDEHVLFEDPDSDDPRRIVYEREGDELSIRLENAAGEVTNAFRMKRGK